MTQAAPERVTGLLLAGATATRQRVRSLFRLSMRKLHRLARRYMRRENAGHTLQTSALVKGAYLRLIEAHRVRWQNRSHFFAVSAKIMRRILVDFARARPEPQERR